MMRQLLMRFLETPPAVGAEPVWPTLDPVQRDVILLTLARLIARAVERGTRDDEEPRDE
jgi:hypothetical protein